MLKTVAMKVVAKAKEEIMDRRWYAYIYLLLLLRSFSYIMNAFSFSIYEIFYITGCS